MQWKSEKKKAMPFGIPMMWLDNSPHQQENCYGCINYHKTLNRRKARNKTYVAVPSVQLPLPHSEFVPVPTYRSIDLQTEYDPGEGTSYEQSVANMLAAFDEIGVNMSYKILLLHQHLDQFAQQLPTESDEQGERYHQTALPFEIRYRGKKPRDAILAEICW
ncbi:PREDICTED: uncharacterized protein LOC108368672, partial [Rhagoletis zephyria]|uniref:uncharacterized protein LOC108368672 n=1 Tax=Rhagoletis zephyria TaxID=28612 RepID=UPI0008118805